MSKLDPQAESIENAAVRLIGELGGDLQKALAYLILKNINLEAELREMRANVSTGFMRGSAKTRLGSPK
jgi:hypothetical protein